MKYFQKKKKLIPLGIFISLYLLVLVPLIVFNLQQRQETRGKAQTPAATCGNVKTDVILVIDRSGSMKGEKIIAAKNSAKRFIDVLASSGIDNRIGLVSFSTSAKTDSQLTDNFTSVKSKVDALIEEGNTCQECGIKWAHDEIVARGRPGVKKVVVMLTDGQANWTVGATRQVDTKIAEEKALTAVQTSFQSQKTVFFTIGLGDKDATGNSRFFGPELLMKIATTTGGKHYFPIPEELEAVYQDISLLIGKGLIGGYFFEDLNTNGVYDTNEPRLQGWKANLSAAGINKTATSDAGGVYTFMGLCDGSYSLKPEIQPGWKQTMPANASGYQVTISYANSFTDKHFGVAKIPPTPTYPPVTPTPYPTAVPTAGLTSFQLTVFHHGIGNSGDNSNPESSLSNKNPVHKTVPVEMQLFDLSNKLLGKGTGQVTYNAQNGNYVGTITITPNTFITGKYLLKVKTDRHLRRLMEGIHTLTAGQHNTNLPAVTLVAGDIDNNNSLNILDYNILLECYSDLAAAANCTAPGKKESSDLNDDGPVNQIDYNLFLREIATQRGE